MIMHLKQVSYLSCQSFSGSTIRVLLSLWSGYDAVCIMSYLFNFSVWNPEAEMILITAKTND